MVLFNVEYEVLSTGRNFTMKGIGKDENDVVNDLVSQVGNIRVLSLYRMSEVHRITGTIRKQIIDMSLMKEPTRGKGRPRKLDL